MKTTITLLDQEFTIEAVLNGESNRISENHTYEYEITVTCNNDSLSFLYNTSVADYQAGKNYMEKSELPLCFHCFLSDATYGNQLFEDFCIELGYNNDSIQHLKIYEACEESLNKFKGTSWNLDLYDLLNDLQEKHEC